MTQVEELLLKSALEIEDNYSQALYTGGFKETVQLKIRDLQTSQLPEDIRIQSLAGQLSMLSGKQTLGLSVTELSDMQAITLFSC